MLSYLIVDHLHERFSCLEGFFRRFVQGFVYNLTSRSFWSSFRWFTMRKFSEGSALSIGPFQKILLEMMYFPYVVEKLKSRRKMSNICSIHAKCEISSPCNFSTPHKKQFTWCLVWILKWKSDGVGMASLATPMAAPLM